MSATDVLKLQGGYVIQTNVGATGLSGGGSIILDVGSVSGISTGSVYVNGNLVVRGTQSITDTFLTLNSGEIGGIGGKVANGTSGLKISRGNNGTDDNQYAAFLQWDDNAVWHGSGQKPTVNGIWEFKVGSVSPQYGAIKVNAIRIDEASAATIGTSPRLNIFGSDNPNSVLSVAGTVNYALNVTDPDDIPNKAYVDLIGAGTLTTSSNVINGHSYLKIIDNFLDSTPSHIIGVIDGDPNERLNITTGTTVLNLAQTYSIFSTIQFVDTQIKPVLTNKNLRFAATGSGQIIAESPFVLQSQVMPNVLNNQVGLYSKDAAGGSTGIYFNSQSSTGTNIQGELVSNKRAFVYSLLFG